MNPATEKILIIDDEKRMCESLTALLEGDGYRVNSYQSSRQAVDSMNRDRFDLVITDIKMPDMDGLEILRHVKGIDDSIPVILMTGYASLETALQAIAEGAYDYLLKPVEFTYLELAVRRALDKRRSELAQMRLMEELKLSNLILQRRVGELNALYEAGKSLGSSLNISELLRQIVVLASTVTEAQVGSIMLLDERKQFLTIAAAIGLDEEIVRKTRVPVGASIAGYVAESGEPLIIEDVENHPRFQRMNREKYGAASLLSIPLRIKNNILGVINMANKQGGHVFSEDDLRLLTTFASQAAVAVDDAYQFAKSRRRLVEFEILHEVARELPQIETLTAFRSLLVEKLKRVFPIDYAIWFVHDAIGGRLVPDGAVGTPDIPLTESGRINLAQVSRESVSLTNLDFTAVDLQDLTEVTRYVGERLKDNSHYPPPAEAYMAIPIIHNDQLNYVFYLGASSSEPYGEDDQSLARLVVSQAALLFEKEKALLNATRLMTMGNMISEISHDLRRPLTSIKGGLQLLKERNPDLPQSSDFFRSAEEEVERMNELVRELVDFSNPNKYETTKVDLRQLVNRAAELLGPDLRKKSIEYSAAFEDINWDVIVNKNQVLEVFLNLFLNASDAMKEGGALTVDGLLEQPPHRKDKYLAVKITDTGVGIKKENISRVFDRYYTTKETGTGLGLAVVERIISAHRGTYHVASAEGEGTTFTVYLPRIDDY